MPLPTRPTNSPPYATLELIEEEFTFLLGNCESNIVFGLNSLQMIVARPNVWLRSSNNSKASSKSSKGANCDLGRNHHCGCLHSACRLHLCEDVMKTESLFVALLFLILIYLSVKGLEFLEIGDGITPIAMIALLLAIRAHQRLDDKD